MICGDARLQRGMNKNLALRIDLEDGAAAVAYEKIACWVECCAGGYTHAFHILRELSGRIDAIDVSLGSRSNEEIAVGIEGQARGVQNSGDEGSGAAIGRDSDDGNGCLLAARAGDGGIHHAGTADRGTGDWMKAVIELAGDSDGRGICCAGGRANFNESGGSLSGYSKDEARRTAH